MPRLKQTAIVCSLLVLPGCGLFSWAASLAAQAAPYLLFFVERVEPTGPSPDSTTDEESVQLALEELSDPARPLPSGLAILEQAWSRCETRPLRVRAIPASAPGSEEKALLVLKELRSEGLWVRARASDAEPLLRERAARGRLQGMVAEGLVFETEGPLSLALGGEEEAPRAE